MAIPGLGKQSNRIAQPSSTNLHFNKALSKSIIPMHNMDRTWRGASLRRIGKDKCANVRELVQRIPRRILFIHGLGASLQYYTPLIQAAGLEESGHRIILYDLEGHGLTPTRASKTATLQTYAEDLESLLSDASVDKATIVGWSLGGLIAMHFAETRPLLVSKLLLLGPGGSPLPAPAVDLFTQRAARVRESGMEASGVAEQTAMAATSPLTRSSRPLALSRVRQYLISTHPEGYAKGCVALAKSRDTAIAVETLQMPTLIIAGRDDPISPVPLVEKYRDRLPNGRLEILDGVGHWHVLEDLEATSGVVKESVN